MLKSKNKLKNYSMALTITMGMFMGLTFFLNILVDPLWFIGGTKIGKKNFAFNERLSKVNLFLNNQQNYDCIVFGSSRTTLLNAQKILGNSCFNFSFSGGRIEEFIEYGKYIKRFGTHPKLVVVGVDEFNFSETRETPPIPFITNFTTPPNIIEKYLSIDVLWFSLKSLANANPLLRYYSENFEARQENNLPRYQPNRENNKWENFTIQKDNISGYQELKEIFPDAYFLGFSNPISSWELLEIERKGQLTLYLKTLSRVSKNFDGFWDFSFPSKQTQRLDNTFDGTHYNLPTYDRIATVLNGDQTNMGISLIGMSEADYITQFKRELTKFKLKLAASSPPK